MAAVSRQPRIVKCVGDNQQCAAGKRRCRHDDAVVAAGHDSNKVRYYETDKADYTDGRHGQRGCECGSGKN